MAFEPSVPRTRVRQVPEAYERALKKATSAGQVTDEEASVLRLVQIYGQQQDSSDAEAALETVARRKNAIGTKSDQAANEALMGLRQQGGQA